MQVVNLFRDATAAASASRRIFTSLCSVLKTEVRHRWCIYSDVQAVILAELVFQSSLLQK